MLSRVAEIMVAPENRLRFFWWCRQIGSLLWRDGHGAGATGREGPVEEDRVLDMGTHIM